MAGRKGHSGAANRLSPAQHLLRGTFNPTRRGPRPSSLAVATVSQGGRRPRFLKRAGNQSRIPLGTIRVSLNFDSALGAVMPGEHLVRSVGAGPVSE